jgi:hypothetical protein
MSDEVTVERLAALFKQTGEAHHEAFLDTDGDDPEWPLWYAKYLGSGQMTSTAPPIQMRHGRSTTRGDF